MRAALFYGGPDIRVEELPNPAPGPGEVLVRVRAAGVCGSDLHGYRRARPAAAGDTPRERRQSGHELAGTVEALGDGVTGLTRGQRVGIEPEHLIGCGACRDCLRGETHLCPRRGQRHGERHSSHGFSELDVCDARNVHALPDSVSFDAASTLDCYACAVHAARRAPVPPHATVVVIGTGMIGMNVGQVARSLGAGRVLMTATRREPIEVARRAGAADDGVAASEGDPVQAILDLTGGEGAEVVYETVGGDAPTLDQAVRMARRGGTVCVMGMFTTPPSIDVALAYRKELTIVWSNSYSRWDGVSEYQIALDLVAKGKVDVGPLITHHFSLEEIGAAFAAANDKRTSQAIKVLVHA